MEPIAEYKQYYLASILLQSNAYEAEIDEKVLEAMRKGHAASETASARVLPGIPNREYFIDRFFSELVRLPFGVEVTNTDEEYRRQVDGFNAGRPDPANPNGLWRALSLDLRMELRGKRDAKIFFNEFAREELVCISIAFDPSTIRGGRWRKEVSPQQERDLPRFREFLLALIDVYPVISGTLGLGIIAVSPDLPHGENRLDNGKLLHKFLSKARQGGYEENVDCIYIDACHWGFDKPFVYDCIEPRIDDKGAWAGRRCYDMHLVEEMRSTAERAEKAYARMYDSKYPKDDKDDALGYLSTAIKQATELGLEKEVVRLKEHYEHIIEVFNSQFRR